jgi:hypothetical protein
MAAERKKYKSYRLCNKVKKRPLRSLRKIFEIFHLDDIRADILQWQQLALANDQSAYDEGTAREQLMEFCNELIRLAEALHIINERNQERKKLPKEVTDIIEKINQSASLTIEEKSNPLLIINGFCKMYSYNYVRTELWDLLEAVISYEGKKKVNKGSLLLLYQSMLCLLKVAYTLHKQPAEL